LEDDIECIINDKPEYTLKNMLSGMKKRFPMYFGSYDLENFRAFFDGYIRCKKDYNIELDDFENKIVKFVAGIKCNLLDMEGKHVTWDRKYRYNLDWDSWGQINEKQGKEIIDKFFEELGNNTGEVL
jgi:hypothetical protein